MSAPSYRSEIPADAEQRITASYPDGTVRAAEYWRDGSLVGNRRFDEAGRVWLEEPLVDGRRHGTEYEWSEGRLVFTQPWVDGLQHGTSYQWDERGSLVGSFVMERGTGLDMWWSWIICPPSTNRPPDPPWLEEVHTYVAGRRHGFESWLHSDHRLWQERHWWQDQLHGIEREWSFAGRLRRGYPNYYVHGVEVTKRQYLRAAAKDPTLPPFREADQLPVRDFPPEVSAHLRPPYRHGADGVVMLAP